VTVAPAFAALDADDIARMLPHRHPFLLLDRVIELEPGVAGTAIKNISVSDPVLAGHFPGRMIYPGVLLVECIAQLAAVVYGSGALSAAGSADLSAAAGRVGYLAEISRVKFLQPVRPGDQLLIKAKTTTRVGSLMSVQGQISVGRDLVMTARLGVTERTDH